MSAVAATSAFIRPLADLSAADVPVAGGKGANLGELIRAGFPVPDGFVISTGAYAVAAEAAGVAPDSPASARVRLIASPVPAGIAEAVREAYRALPDVAELELVETVAGLRPATPDNAPLVGPGAMDGLVLATGHYRNGILLTPISAEAVAALLASEPLPPEAENAHPGRFAGESAPGLAAAPTIDEAPQ